MPVPPTSINVSTLISAKGDVLRYWIKEANDRRDTPKCLGNKKALTQQGNVEQLRQKLADYYAIDLSMIPTAEAISGPLPVSQHIQQRQWANFRALGHEWRVAIDAGQVFRLEKPQASSSSSFVPTAQLEAALRSLPEYSPTSPTDRNRGLDLSTLTNDTVYAWLGALGLGDQNALTNLQKLRVSLNLGTCLTTSSPYTMPTSIPPLSPPSSQPASTTTLIHPPSSAPPSPPPISTRSPISTSRAIVKLLSNCATDIQALNRVEGLRDVIDQVERGEVQEFRSRYGPTNGLRSGADPMWSKINGSVTRRERLYRQLETEFSGDKDTFFAFFTVPDDGKKKKRPSEEQLRPFRKVVEAIPRRDKALVQERAKSKYFDASGLFSEQVWVEIWGGRNRWEVWRDLGLESY